jgi:peptidoglycan/LPS O-acetylase OafA/YrhL
VSAQARPGRRLEHLDALRGLAACSVLVYHILTGLYGSQIRDHLPIDLGQFGVLLFFVISGYVIAMSVEHVSLGTFWARRVLRLYPAYWCSVALAVGLALAGRYHTTGQLYAEPARCVLTNLTMVQRLIGGYDLIDVYWTLLIEMVFYLLVTLVVLLGWFRRSLALALALVGLGFLTNVVLGGGYIDIPIISYLALMLMGTLFYRWSRGELAGWALAGAGALCCALLVSIPDVGSVVLARLLALPFFALAWRAALAPRALVFLGTISYSLYLLHVPLIAAIRTGWPALDVALWLGATLLAATLTYYAVELPAIRLGRRLTARERVSR